MYRLVDENGHIIEARFDLVHDGNQACIVVESKGGSSRTPSSRNPDYNHLVRTLLSRLAANGVMVTQIILDSARVRKLPVHERVVHLERPYPVDLSLVTIDEFRTMVGNKVSSMHQAPGAKSKGNSQKRIRICLDRPATPAMLGAMEAGYNQGGAQQAETGTQVPFGGDAVDGAVEGSPRRRLALHRRRERRLRDQKLQDHLDRGLGLACEVPGCGFDFHKSYGELGRGYAHVHHLRPLGARVEDEATNLGDLAIVCANCHAMIHRGRQCRHLVGLVPRGPTLIRPAVIADEGHVTELAAEFGKFGDYVPVFLRMLHHRHPIGYGVGQDVELLVHLDGSGMPVGFGAVEWHASHADIHGIAVHPRSRRRGVAANLLDHVSGSATGRGILELRCNTAAQANPAALGFFTTRGFDVVGPAPFNFPRGQAAVQLRRRLD